jgi:hypothetical protein
MNIFGIYPSVSAQNSLQALVRHCLQTGVGRKQSKCTLKMSAKYGLPVTAGTATVKPIH